MIIFILQVLLSGVLAYFSSKLIWWLPLIIFPIMLKIFIYCKGQVDPVYYDCFYEKSDDSDSEARKWGVDNDPYYILFDSFIMLVYLSWILVSSIICYKSFLSWWGILIGLIVGIVGCTVTIPLRWHRARITWHENRATAFSMLLAFVLVVIAVWADIKCSTAFCAVLGGLALQICHNLLGLVIAKPALQGKAWAFVILHILLWPIVPIAVALYAAGFFALIIQACRAGCLRLFG